MIQVRALTRSINTGTHRVDILKGIDLEIPRGQFAAIMGPSGSGKSTLLGLLAGLDTPTSGQVILDGEDITNLAEDEMALLRGRKIGFVFQSYHLISTLTAEENVLLPMELAGAEAGGRERARELLERVGLGGRFDHYPVQLSGGEQQRVALARAFALRPPILLADEPTGNLDSTTGRAVLDLLLALNREQGTTMVMVTHEQSLADSADRRIVLHDGLVVSQWPANEPPMTPRPKLSWRAAIRIAWREMRSSRAKFLFVVLSVAIGVGSLTGVRGFSNSFRHMLLGEARTLMAGDLTARVFALPNSEQEAALRRLDGRGVRHTWITETVTMASSPSTPDPLLISVKAVDPTAYPYYGVVKLNPPRPLREALDPQAVVVSDDLLVRLNVRTGEQLHIGGQDFRIAGVMVSEPDRMTGSLNVGPRVMISRAGLDRTGLITPGSRAAERYLFALPAQGGPDVAEARAVLKAAFPEATIADYRETHPIITRGLDRATTFLSLIGLIALVIGAMGVASAMHGHLQQKLDSIAVMKCMGARSNQIIRIYTAQTLMLGLGGGLIGVAFGAGVAAAFPGLIAKYFAMDVSPYWDFWPALQGIAVACLVTLLFTLPPLLGIRDIRPAAIFRRDVDAPGARRASAPAWLARVAILLGTGAVAGTLTEGSAMDAVRTGSFFALALAIGLALLSLAGWAMLRGFRWLLRVAGARLPGVVRHGMANLYRPGNQASAAVVALGVGVMFTLAVFLVQSALVEQIRGSAPPGMPNVFLLDIPANQRTALSAFIGRQAGVKEAPDVAFAVAARITAIDGTPIENRNLRDFNRRFLRTRQVTAMTAMPQGTVILEGAWWQPADRDPQICASEETAKILNLKLGALVDWNIYNRNVRTRVACIDRTESIRMSGRFEFIFNEGHLDNLPAVYYGSARVRPADVAALQREVYRRFPTVTVVNIADVMQIVEDVVQRIAAVIRFISGFTILAGAVMVASSVAGTRFRRMKEVVTLKTLGATRRRIAWIFSVEFIALGMVAGLMGSLLAGGFAALVLKRLLQIDFHPSVATHAAAVAIAALVAVAAGWSASFRILGRKPLEILRDE